MVLLNDNTVTANFRNYVLIQFTAFRNQMTENTAEIIIKFLVGIVSLNQIVDQKHGSFERTATYNYQYGMQDYKLYEN